MINEDYISIIVAVKNEEKRIRECILSLLNQRLSPDLFDIVVVDGLSDDNTLNIIKDISIKYSNRIRVYINKKELQSSGRNIGIRNSPNSKFIAYIDGHCIADEDWLYYLYSELIKRGDDVAGVGSVVINPKDESYFGRIINSIFQSVIGGYGSSYQNTKIIKIVNTSPFALYRKSVLENINLYDESLMYGEDYDLNMRIKKEGYKLYVNPLAKVQYYKRKNISSFIKQMYNYGMGKAINFKKYKFEMGFLPIFPFILFMIYFLTGIEEYLTNNFHFTNYLTIIYISLILLSSATIVIKEKS